MPVRPEMPNAHEQPPESLDELSYRRALQPFAIAADMRALGSAGRVGSLEKEFTFPLHSTTPLGEPVTVSWTVKYCADDPEWNTFKMHLRGSDRSKMSIHFEEASRSASVLDKTKMKTKGAGFFSRLMIPLLQEVRSIANTVEEPAFIEYGNTRRTRDNVSPADVTTAEWAAISPVAAVRKGMVSRADAEGWDLLSVRVNERIGELLEQARQMQRSRFGEQLVVHYHVDEKDLSLSWDEFRNKYSRVRNASEYSLMQSFGSFPKDIVASWLADDLQAALEDHIAQCERDGVTVDAESVTNPLRRQIQELRRPTAKHMVVP